MTAIDAFHVKQTIYETLYRDDFHRYARGFVESLMEDATEQQQALPGYATTGDQLVAREVRVARLSETFYVAPVMQAMVTAAAETWPEDEAITDEDWPTTHGFMYVPGGISVIDVRGQVSTTVAFTWEVQGNTTHVVWWTDKHYDSPYQRARYDWDSLPTYTPWHITVLKHGHPLPTALVMGTVIPPEIGRQMRWVANGGQQSLMIPLGFSPDDLKPHVGVDRVSAWLVAALRIMQQPLATVDRKGMPANVRKRLDRRPMTLRQKAVTVIDFRRREADFEHHGAREYSHRFLRRGHWRRQPYKRDDGTWDRRRIWIHATIVGDPDKPLILRNHVNALMR
jgi:hypothetical protein